jgi:hypothetical protein
MALYDAAESSGAESADAAHQAPTTDTPVANRKTRSPVERRIVRGVIAVLVLVMLIELYAYFSFQSDYAAIAEARDTDTITESDVRRLVTRYSSVESDPNLTANELVATREDSYRYWGLLKRRTLYVYYGVVVAGETEAEVLDVRPDRAEFAPVGTRRPTAPGPIDWSAMGAEPPETPVDAAESDRAEPTGEEPASSQQ